MGVFASKIAVCEDNGADIDTLRSAVSVVLKQLCFEDPVDYFDNCEEMLAAIRCGGKYDLLILDIYMEGLNGMDAAQQAKSFLPDVQIAFTTSSRDFAPEAFDINAIHYIVKPVTPQKIEDLFQRFFNRMEKPTLMMKIQSAWKDYNFPLHHVQKIQSSKKGVDVYLNGSTEPQRIPLSFMRTEEQLDPSHFLKVSRGLIVQMDYILCIDKDICRFKDNTEVLISRGARAEIRKKYNDYLFGNLKKKKEEAQ